MPTDDRALFLSVRPRYAELLMNGSKRVELRRTVPNVEPGATVLIYASSPVRALVGTAVVDEVTVGTPRAIWASHGEDAAVARSEFNEYFSGARSAVALELCDVKKLPQPVPLDELRAGRAWFTPPQSFRYLDAEQLGSFGVRRRKKRRLAVQLRPQIGAR